MKMYDKITGFFIADPEIDPLAEAAPDYRDVLASAESMILSASGWRKIFTADGNEESTIDAITTADTVIAGITALSFSKFLKEYKEIKNPHIAVGMDSRHTGPAICNIMSRIFLAEGLELDSLFITAAPEIMAYSSLSPDVDGFAYISASHNPVGHNGLKFGMEGGVSGGNDSKVLIKNFKSLLHDPEIVKIITGKSAGVDTKIYEKVLAASASCKEKASSAYLSLSRRTIADSPDSETQKAFFATLAASTVHKPMGVIAELNGSARTLSIDREILSSAGISYLSFNDKPREIVHRIVPEGFSLDTCRELLEEEYSKNSAFVLGYVPDNDGDRGNVVYIDHHSGKAKILEAQEVFALAVLGELAFLSTEAAAKTGKKLAVAVNGPTSMRIDRIAEAFNAEVFRAEVGEANVVSLASELRGKGFTVRILGEGSNGGNITHPAMVRDPINTLFALLKLLLVRGNEPDNDLFKTWCRKSRQDNAYKSDYTLSDIIATLPSFITTSAYESRAIMNINTTNHALLKQRYEEIFMQEWDKKKAYLLEHFGIVRWREIQYEGINTREGTGSIFRTGEERGGLKIVFMDRNGLETDYIWMRGSGTEPVFRILADCKGTDKEREEWFLNWHRSIIERADKGEVK